MVLNVYGKQKEVSEKGRPICQSFQSLFDVHSPIHASSKCINGCVHKNLCALKAITMLQFADLTVHGGSTIQSERLK